MGLFRPSRVRRGPDPFLQWKMMLFAVGAAFGLAGIFTGRDWLLIPGIVILAVGVALRWLPRDGGDDGEPPDQGEPPEIPPPT